MTSSLRKMPVPKGLAGREIGLLIGVLLLAAVLRMGWPGLSEFKLDEALLLARALDMAQFDQFHVRGISSSVGFPNFPMSVWLYALPLLAWHHVYAATLFTGLLNVVAVFGCWWLVRRYWGGQAAIAAALMFAASPWAVFHSQKIWAQNLLAPLVIGWAIGAALALVDGRKGFILLHLLCLAVAVQVHFAAIALLPVTLLLLVIFRRRVSWRLVFAGAALALLTALPFLIYLLRSDLLERGLSAGGLQRAFNLSAWRFTWLLSTGREIHALAGPEQFRNYLASVPDLTLVHVLWIGLVLLGLLWLARHIRNRWKSEDPTARMALIVLLWLLIPPLFFTVPLFPVELHYLLPIYPAPYIVAGVAFSMLLNRLGRLRWAGWTVLGLSITAQVWVWLGLLNLIGSRSTPGGYGTPVRYLLEAAGRARTTVEETGGQEVLIAGIGENPQQDPFAAIYDVLLRDVPHRFVDASRSAVFPAGASVVLIDKEMNGPAVAAYLGQASQVTRLPLRQDEGILQILTLPPDAAPSPEVRLEPAYLYANWISLFGHDRPAPEEGGTALWRIYWRTADNPDPNDYHFFNHLVDGAGHRLGQADAPAFSPWQWHSGDTVISIFHLPWPAGAQGPLTVRAGVYTYPQLANVPLMDVAGNPYAEAAELVIGD